MKSMPGIMSPTPGTLWHTASVSIPASVREAVKTAILPVWGGFSAVAITGDVFALAPSVAATTLAVGLLRNAPYRQRSFDKRVIAELERENHYSDFVKWTSKAMTFVDRIAHGLMLAPMVATLGVSSSFFPEQALLFAGAMYATSVGLSALRPLVLGAAMQLTAKPLVDGEAIRSMKGRCHSRLESFEHELRGLKSRWDDMDPSPGIDIDDPDFQLIHLTEEVLKVWDKIESLDQCRFQSEADDLRIELDEMFASLDSQKQVLVATMSRYGDRRLVAARAAEKRAQ